MAEIANKAILTSFHKYCYFLKSKALMVSNIRKRDVFHPGMKYLYGRYCPCCFRDGMQNIMASYKRKIKLVKKLLQSSNLVYCPAPVIIPSLITHNSPLRTSKTLSYRRSVKPNTSVIFALLCFNILSL